MNREPQKRTGRPRARRTAVPRAALLLPLAATAVLAGPPAAFADGEPAVRLPVMTARLADGAACAGPSTTTATATPWEHRSLELSRAAPISQGAGVTVGVVDTGVSTGAPALAGRVDALGPAGDDCVGHGTFVAGLIAAAPVKGIAFQGIAPRARIVAVRGTDERGAPSAAGVAAGIRGAVDAGARVVQVSAAFGTRSPQLDAAVSYAVRHDALVVAAAVPDPPSGTGGASAPAPRDYWPAASPGVLSVLDVDVEGGRPDTALLPVHADLAAPGDAVVGIGPRGKGHFVASGASLAAAYTAGAAALVRSAFPDLPAAGVARRLTSTAYPDDVPRLDAYAAVASVTDGPGTSGARTGAHEGSVRLPDRTTGERATRTALLVSALGAAVVLVAAWTALAVPRGRARGWHPTRRS
ncbi:S8 family serine peptidase [Streptomyces sp. NPDC058008]|uniref:S8 family serine peptidase n=1 Tax=Streptomyces sp. NPDC058008 TaxID=3346303 RepID=UPI0036E1EB0F